MLACRSCYSIIVVTDGLQVYGSVQSHEADMSRDGDASLKLSGRDTIHGMLSTRA